MSKQKHCLFCKKHFSKENKSTNEHVLADWVVQGFELSKKPLHQVRYKIRDAKDRLYVKGKDAEMRFKKVKSSGRRMSIGNAFVLGGVCEDCNNGFLSEIEKMTKPLLVGLIDKNKTELNEKEALIISCWAYKTALVLNRASSHKKFWNGDDYNNFYLNWLPENDLIITLSLLEKEQMSKEGYFLQMEGVSIQPKNMEMEWGWRISRETGIYKGLVKAPGKHNEYLSFSESTKIVILNIKGVLLKVVSIPLLSYPVIPYFKTSGELVLYPPLEKIKWPPENTFRSMIQLRHNLWVKWN